MGLRALTSGITVALAVTFGLTAAGPFGVQEQESEGDQPAGDDRALRRLPVFGALDADDDGEISAGEIDAAAESLASLDDDGDGSLSGDELRPRREPIGGPARTPPEATAAFMTFDADEDGVLDTAELPSQFLSLLARADADGDGAAGEAEILALLTAEAEPPPETEPEPETDEDEEEESAEAGGGGEPARPRIPLMAALDADGDGTVSAAEVASAPRSLRSLDADGDGRLAQEELRPPADGESEGDGGAERGGALR